MVGQREEITFALGLTGQRQVTQGLGKVVAGFKAIEASGARIAAAFAKTTQAQTAAAQQGARAQVSAQQQVQAAANQANQQDKRRTQEWINRRRRRLNSFRRFLAEQRRGERQRVADAARRAREIERLAREQAREQETIARRREREEQRELARRLARFRRFFSSIRSISIASGAGVARTGGALGVFGPAIRSSGSAIRTQVERLGGDAGQTFGGSFIKSVTQTLATLPQAVGKVVGGLSQAFGALLKSLSGSIVALGSSIGLAFGPVGAAVSAVVSGILAGFTGLAGGILQAFGGAVDGATQILGGLVSVAGNVFAQVADVLQQVAGSILGAVSSLVQKVVGGILSAVSGVLGRLGGIVGGIVKQVFGPLGVVIAAASIKATADIRDKLIDAFALLDERGAATTEAVARNFQELARRVGVSATEIATQSFDVISAGFRDVLGGTEEILRRSSELAVAGSANVAEAGRAIVTILKALKLDAEDAAAASKLLFDIQDRGRITIQEVANEFGSLVPSLVAAKLPVEEVGAAFATLTLSGETASESATLLSQAILNLAAPTPLAASNMRALGVELRELTEAEDQQLRRLEELAIAERERLEQLERSGADTREQAAVVKRLEDRFRALVQVSGQFVGLEESIRRIKVALQQTDAEALVFLRPILGRIRAQKGVSFLLENFEEFQRILDQTRNSSDKFFTALEDDQRRVTVQVKQTLTAFQQLGVAIFDLGAAATGGRGFAAIRSVVDALRRGVEDLVEPVGRFREDFLNGLAAIREAIVPVTDLIGQLFAQLAAPDIRISFSEVVGIINELSAVIAGQAEVGETVLGRLFDVVATRAQIAFNRIKQELLSLLSEFGPRLSELIGAFATTLQTITQTVARAVTDMVRAVGDKVGPGGLIKLIFTGGEALAGFDVEETVRQLNAQIAEAISGVQLQLSPQSLEAGTTATQQAIQAVSDEIDKLSLQFVQAAEEVERRRKQLLEPGALGGFTETSLKFSGGTPREVEVLRAGIVEERLEPELTSLDRIRERLGEAIRQRDTLEEGLDRLAGVEDEAQRERLESAAATTEEGRQLQAQLEVREELLAQARRAAEERGAAIREQAEAARAVRLEEEASLRARSEALADLKSIAFFEERRRELAERLGDELDAEGSKLQEIFDRVREINEAQLSGTERLEAQRSIMEDLVALAGDQNLTQAELIAILDQIANRQAALRGLGNLQLRPPIPLEGPPALPPVDTSTSGAAGNLLKLLKTSVDNQTEELGSQLQAFSTGGLQLSSLTGNAQVDFKNALLQAFAQSGFARPGVGSFVGQSQLSQGQGFIPIEQVPIKSFVQQAAAGQPVGPTTSQLLQAANALLQQQKTGELPGQRFGGPGFLVKGGQVAGVSPEAAQQAGFQRALEQLASQKTVLSMLDELGLSNRQLGFIRDLLQEQLAEEKRVAEAEAPFRAGEEKFETTGRISKGGLSKIGRAQAQVGEAQAAVSDIEGELAELGAAAAEAAAGLEEAAEATDEASQATAAALAGQLATLEAQIADKSKELGSAQDDLADAKESAKKALGSAQAQETLGGISSALDLLSNAAPLFDGLQEALDRFQETGEVSDDFASVLEALGEKDAARLFEKAGKKPKGKEAEALKLAELLRRQREQQQKEQAEERAKLGESAEDAADATGEVAEGQKDTSKVLKESFDQIKESSTEQETSLKEMSESATEFGTAEVAHAQATTQFAQTTTNTFETTKDVLEEHDERLDELEQQLEEIRAAIAALAGAGGGGGGGGGVPGAPIPGFP